MKILYSFFILLFFISSTPLLAQFRLQVIDPDDWWWPFGESGRIEEATVSLEPKGVYTEVGLYLTISDDGLNWPQGMDLEIVLDFNLPPGSIIHDSWLWMPDDDIIVKAEVYDISKAILTYEEIVDRNRDPSILYKKEDSNYQIRIYPLRGGESRKIKITYLCPTKWTSEAVSTWIPTDIFNTSNYPLEHIKIIAVEDEDWKNPRLEGAPDVTFSQGIDPVFGEVQYAYLPGNQLNLPIRFVVDAPFDNHNYYVSKLESPSDNFYQLVYLPPPLTSAPTPRNYLFAINNTVGNSLTSSEQLLSALYAEMKETLLPEDRFNIAYGAGSQIKFISDQWLEATAENLNQHLQPISPMSAWSTKNLLAESIQFATDNELQTDIVLLTNANDMDNWSVSDEAEEIVDLLENQPIVIHTIDYQTSNFEVGYEWGETTDFESPNLDFYRLIGNYTHGNLMSIFQGDLNLWSMLDHMMSNLTLGEFSFDLHTKMDQGFTYSRHNINPYQNPDPNDPFLQVGKYSGDFPMEIEFSALTNNEFVYEEEWINSSSVAQEDSLTREMWMGNEIKFLEGNLSSSSGIQAIVDLSITERVLSKYTAFLALDLENGGDPCANCWEVGNQIIINVDEKEEENKYSISAAPNPFSESTIISIDLKDGNTNQLQSISLYDAFGKRLSILTDAFSMTRPGHWEWAWNGTDQNNQQLATGVYFVVMQTDQEPINLKLVIVK